MNSVFFSHWCTTAFILMSLFDTYYCSVKCIGVPVTTENIRDVQNSCISSHLSWSTFHIQINSLIPVRKYPLFSIKKKKKKCGVWISWPCKLPLLKERDSWDSRESLEIPVTFLKLVSFGFPFVIALSWFFKLAYWKKKGKGTFLKKKGRVKSNGKDVPLDKL